MKKETAIPVRQAITSQSAETGEIVQAKLTVGQAGDQYEQEADAVADKVMRMPEENFIQKKCAHCEEEEKQVQRKPIVNGIVQAKGDGNVVAGDTVSSKINSSRGNGSTMDSNTQSFMSSRFGTDFSQVKIHTDREAVQMSKELNAKAFTTGNDIYFNEGQYQPGSDSGKQLLAHELTHTVQQGAAGQKIQKFDFEDCNGTQQTDTNSAVDRAKEMLRNAISRLNASPVTATTQTLFGYHFGAYANWRRDVVVWHLSRDLDLLNTWDFTYQCEDECDGDKAYTYWVFGDIHLCPQFFSSVLNEQAETLIHELHHLDKMRGHFDLGYHNNNEDAQTSWPVAVNNADSYSELVQDLWEQP